MKRTWWAIALSSILAALPAGATAEDPAGIELTPEARTAIQKGLNWLARSQTLDGSWNSEFRRNTGVNSMAVLAFVANGHLPGRGPYGITVAKGVDWIVRQAAPNGMITRDCSHGPMYEHAMSSLMLAEVWGMTRRPDIRVTLKKAIDLIIASQGRNGSWGYQPQPTGGDISVTIMQLMALRAAHDAGIEVPTETIERGVGFVKRCQNPDGGFSYMEYNGVRGPSALARSAAGVASLQFAGKYKAEEEAIKKGIAYLLQELPKGDAGNYYYAHYYGAHAAYFAGEPYWSQWYTEARRQLLAKQGADGSWNGSVLNTAWSVLVLSIPHRYLPIYQR